jgi:hypothetical protein
MRAPGPGQDWKEAILRIIKLANQRVVSLQAIYAEMKHQPIVTPYHMEPWRPGLQPRYQCWIPRCLTDLVTEGKIQHVSTGEYSFVHS